MLRLLASFALLGSIALPFTASSARAASGTCTVNANCVGGQACRIIGAAATGTCTWEATSAQSLGDAIAAANADEARDVIFIGDIDPVDELGAPLPGPVGAEIHLDTAVADDGGAVGARALPRIRSAITVEGLSSATSIIDIDADIRLFLLQVDPATQRRPDLLVKNVTLRDARPSAGASGAGAITVDGTATAPVTPLLPELPIVVVEDVRFDGGRGDTATAGAIHNDGAPLRVDGCTFENNSAGAGAGAITSSSGGVIVSSEFIGNQGTLAGAVHVPNATRVDELDATVDVTLQVNATTFDNNSAQGGALVSLAEETTLGNDTFRGNRANEQSGGAVSARGLLVQVGTFEDNTAQVNGGAIAIIDVPPSGAVLIAGADFRRNRAVADGGAVHHTGATLTIDQCVFEENRSNGPGGALAITGLVERNGAVADARITASIFQANIARPNIALLSSDVTIDELGGDEGRMSIALKGLGSAIAVSLGGVTEISGSCIQGNGADAVFVAQQPATLRAEDNWWGAATGPGPTGGGDLPGAGISTAQALTSPAEPCIENAFAAAPQLFIPAILDQNGVSGGFATIAEDFRLIDAVRGIQILNSNAGDLVPNLRLGVLDVVARGVNDLDADEGVEGARFAIVPCNGGDCPYITNGVEAVFTVINNGNGLGEGEGEGEGEDCEETLAVSATALEFANTGEPVEKTLTIINKSPCEVQLLRPFVQAGASQGFAVDPILQTALVLPPAGAVDVVVRFTPPPPEEADPDFDETEGGGLLRVETARGTLAEVSLTVAQGCACSSSAPAGAPGACLALLGWVALRLASRGLPKRRRIP